KVPYLGRQREMTRVSQVVGGYVSARDAAPLRRVEGALARASKSVPRRLGPARQALGLANGSTPTLAAASADVGAAAPRPVHATLLRGRAGAAVERSAAAVTRRPAVVAEIHARLLDAASAADTWRAAAAARLRHR